MKFDKKYITGRFTIVLILVFMASAYIAYCAVSKMFFEHDKWQRIAEVSVVDSLPLMPSRGNILSADGQLMASSLPNYRVYIDFLAGGADRDSVAKHKRDSVLTANMDSICRGLHEICPEKTAEEYKEHMLKGMEKKSRYWEICKGRLLNYIQYNELLKLPVFCEKNMNKSGLNPDPRNNRKKPFGSLARRTLGDMYATVDSGRTGLEHAYDSLLRGKPGQVHRKKVLNKFLSIVDKEPEDGYDLISTIDVSMQDICESALREKLEELDAEMGVVVLMEVKTGDVKAIVNLQRDSLRTTFYEGQNYALAALLEPGSTFKTASILVALDDGYINKHTIVDTESGIVNMYGAKMKDHNWNRGGYHVIDVTKTLMVSSNIGVSKLINKYYHEQPEKFVEGLHRVGMGVDLGLPFKGVPKANIRMPKPDGSNWSKTALPWMSVGYETQIPPIYTIAFYNAIANNGKMVRPRFVRGIERKGEIVEEFPVEVIKQQICKKSALDDIQEILEKVVSEGLGKKAGNPRFKVSGKTGTAQISSGGGYKTGKNEHLVSFCGYFPSEDPRYTCIVAIRHAHYVASGGGQAGPVFSKISQRVYSKNITSDLSTMRRDSATVYVPSVKVGNEDAAKYVLTSISAKGSAPMQNAMNSNNAVVPDVTGMGARDAIFMLEKRGLKVRLTGRGKVKSQSIAAGSKFTKGQRITIALG